MKKLIIIIGFLIIAIGYILFQIYIHHDEYILQGKAWYQWLNQQNIMIAGAITVWALGSLSYLGKDIPSKIWNFIIKQSTLTLTINNEHYLFYKFLNWYKDQGYVQHSRTMVAIDEDSGSSVSAGYGTHYFIYHGKIFKWFREEDSKASTNSKKTKERIVITCLGRSKKIFLDMLKEVSPSLSGESINIFKLVGWWRNLGFMKTRPLDSVIISPAYKESILQHLDNFFSSKEWYEKHGIPYRTGMLLHGLPGTGKTSLVKALANHYQKPLYIMNLSQITDEDLEDAWLAIPKDNCFVLIEDIDTYSIAKSREEENNGSILSLGTLLNCIDGVVETPGRVIFATTNRLKTLDSALIRRGRFDLQLELTHVTDECMILFMEKFFPDYELPQNLKFKDISPAYLQGIILDHKGDPEKVLELITK